MKKTYIFFLLITTIILLIYSNTFSADWHFDDFTNITQNHKIQIKELSIQNIKNSMFSYPDKPDHLYRPISCLSFAINSYFSGNSTIGFHITNIILHIFTAICLFIFMQEIFKTPAMKQHSKEHADFICFFTTALWAVHPIQTQAVTYIVQRMAILSALFSILALIFYIKARLSKIKGNSIKLWVATTLFYILSILSKENGFITVFSFLLIEIVLFDYIKLLKIKSTYKIIILSCMAGILCVFLLHVFPDKINHLLNYSERPFTLLQRVLTQPRVIFFYISLILYPVPNRFSIEHDIIYSDGLFIPISTFVSIVILICIILFAFFMAKRQPLTSLTIFFFLLNHIIESSVIPLEMIFEHRNYLPSIFIFAPAGQLICFALKKFKDIKPVINFSISAFCVCYFFLLCFGTYIRNADWATEKTLWENAAEKAPTSPRVWHNLAFIAEKEKNYAKSWELYHKALSLQKNMQMKINLSVIHSNIAHLYYRWKNDREKAMEILDTAIELNPDNSKAYLMEISIRMDNRNWDKALETLKIIRKKAPNYTDAYNFIALCNLYLKKYSEALFFFQKHLINSPYNYYTLMNIGETMSALKQKDRADFFFRIAASIVPSNSGPYLSMCKNNYFNGDIYKASYYLKCFFQMTGAEKIKREIKKLSNNMDLPLLNIEEMKPFIKQEFEKYKQEIDID